MRAHQKQKIPRKRRMRRWRLRIRGTLKGRGLKNPRAVPAKRVSFVMSHKTSDSDLVHKCFKRYVIM